MYPGSLLVRQKKQLVSLVMRGLKTPSHYVPKFLLYSPGGTQPYSTLHECPPRHKLYIDEPTSSSKEKETLMMCDTEAKVHMHSNYSKSLFSML